MEGRKGPNPPAQQGYSHELQGCRVGRRDHQRREEETINLRAQARDRPDAEALGRLDDRACGAIQLHQSGERGHAKSAKASATAMSEDLV